MEKLTLHIDESKIRRLIEENRPKRIVLNAPDGLLRITRDLGQQLERDYTGLRSIVICDPSYGSCDTVDVDAQRLGGDIAFHVGHNITIPKFGKITYPVDAFDDVKFDKVAVEASIRFKELGFAVIGLATFAQHIHEILPAARVFEEQGIKAIVGKGLGQLHDGQIFGCEFYPAFNIKDKVDAMALLGQSMFHAIGLALSSAKPTFMLDPYSNVVFDLEKTANERLTRSILSVYKARDSERFGVLICLKEGQIMIDQSIKLKEKLESLGKKVQLIAIREITSERLDTLTDVDAFVQTGCPRISVDGYNFSKPVLSVPQTDALISLLSGRELESSLFVRNHWL